MKMGSSTKTRLETCLRASGELDGQAAAEATEKALDSLLAHRVVEDMNREDAKG